MDKLIYLVYQKRRPTGDKRLGLLWKIALPYIYVNCRVYAAMQSILLIFLRNAYFFMHYTCVSWSSGQQLAIYYSFPTKLRRSPRGRTRRKPYSWEETISRLPGSPGHICCVISLTAHC